MINQKEIFKANIEALVEDFICSLSEDDLNNYVYTALTVLFYTRDLGIITNKEMNDILKTMEIKQKEVLRCL